MSSLIERLTASSLPDTIPVFPIQGCVLLPGGRLPLNVFEPRYKALVENALMTRQRLMGMIQPLHNSDTELYQTGCAGRILAFEETDDGRYQVVLQGICRFVRGEELPTTRKYRQFKADWSTFLGDLENPSPRPVDRTALLDTIQRYFERKHLLTDWDILRVAPLDRLVTSLSMMCPFSTPEKQALLEAESLMERLNLLTTFMEMTLRANSQDGAELLH
jgi:hypothetical protein